MEKVRNISFRLSMINWYVLPVLVYELGPWSWFGDSEGTWKKISEDEILRRVKRRRELTNLINARILDYIGYMAWYYILRMIMNWKITRKKSRQGLMFSLRNLREWNILTSLQRLSHRIRSENSHKSSQS